MGLLNVLQAKWDGKVGQTVGAKWKNKATIRAYAKPANPNTASQQSIREIFKNASKFVALFSDQIKTLTSLNTRSMSVRNAILKANKNQFTVGHAFDPTTLIVNKGGLGQLTDLAYDGSTAKMSWDPPTATNISAKAKVVVVYAPANTEQAYVYTAEAKAGELIVSAALAGDTGNAYVWLLDYRGSTRVGSNSQRMNIAP